MKVKRIRQRGVKKNSKEAKEAQSSALAASKAFVGVYLKKTASVLYDEVEEDVKKNLGQQVPLKLEKRTEPLPRYEDLYKGKLWMREGGGVGDFTKWKKVYLEEEESGIINVYTNRKSKANGKKPIVVIQPAGYKYVTEVRQHYMDDLFGTFDGIKPDHVEFLTDDMERYSWALTHPQRQNYIFMARPSQLKPNSKVTPVGICCPKKIGPEVECESEEAKVERERAQRFMKRCINYSRPRSKLTLEGKAFQQTLDQLPQQFSFLPLDWTDEGTEKEILTDVLVASLFETKQNILDKTGPLIYKLKAWYKIIRSIRKMLATIVDGAWAVARAGVKKIRETLEPALRRGLATVIELKIRLGDRIKALVLDKLLAILDRYITPKIQPLMNVFAEIIEKSALQGREILERSLKPECLPPHEVEREVYMNRLMGDRDMYVGIYKCLDDLAPKLKEIQEKDGEKGRLASILQGLLNGKGGAKMNMKTVLKKLTDTDEDHVMLKIALTNIQENSEDDNMKLEMIMQKFQNDEGENGFMAAANVSRMKAKIQKTIDDLLVSTVHTYKLRIDSVHPALKGNQCTAEQIVDETADTNEKNRIKSSATIVEQCQELQENKQSAAEVADTAPGDKLSAVEVAATVAVDKQSAAEVGIVAHGVEKPATESANTAAAAKEPVAVASESAVIADKLPAVEAVNLSIANETYNTLLKDLDHDFQTIRSQIITEVTHAYLLEAFHKRVDFICRPVLQRVDSVIPPPFNQVISVEKVFDEVVNRLIMFPVETAVGRAYPLPQEV